MGTPAKIEKLWAFMAFDGEVEGLVAELIGDKWMPFVCADEARVEVLRPLAKRIQAQSGKTVRLVEFSVRKDLETYGNKFS